MNVHIPRSAEYANDLQSVSRIGCVIEVDTGPPVGGVASSRGRPT